MSSFRSVSTAVTIASLVAFVGVAKESRASPPEPPPAVSDEQQRSPHPALLAAGASVAGVTYAVTASLAAGSERAADRDLFVPVVGPFINLANRNCTAGCNTDSRDIAALWTSAGLQLAGVGLMVASAFVTERTTPPVSRTAADPPSRELRPHRTLLWTSAAIFGVTYATSVVAGGIAGDRLPDKNLFVPVVGPWLDLGQRNCDFRPCDPTQETLFQSLIIASGLLQGGATVLAVSSFVVGKGAGEAATPRIGALVAPVSYPGGGGVGLTSQF